MISLSVNDVLKAVDSDLTYRILWIDEGGIIAYLIDVYDEKAIPFVQSTNEIRQQIVSDELVKVKDFDGHPAINVSITEKQKKHRDDAWDAIRSVVELEPDLYQRDKRGEIVKKLVKQTGISRISLYKYLRRYWQRGKTIDALTPDYGHSGAKGKDRKIGETIETESGEFSLHEQDKKNIRDAIYRYFLSSKKNSLAHAYRMMIKENYASDSYYEDGALKIILKNEEEVPTERMFRYWYAKEFGVEETIVKRQGKKDFERNHRAVLGSSTYEVFGPGSRFQIDATIGDVYLVSSYNPDWIIGRPIIYFVIDVFSRMITGMYIGLEGPSWIGAMMALENTVANKVEYCRKFGITISESQWACEHLPEIILADNGEFEGYKVEPLINGLNVKVENHPAFRPDWKGIVEKMFDTSQSQIKPFLPGYIDKDFRERGAEDYRLKAKLTLEQYTKIMIQFVLHYNNNHHMEGYVREEEMIAAGVKPTPKELWNWGLINRAGKLKTTPTNTIRFYLMPTDDARVTNRGIKFQGMLYSCETAVKESWFTLAKPNQKGSWGVKVSYDARNVSKIYLHDNEKIYETCYLLDHQERYQNKSLDEVKDLLKRERQDNKKQKHTSLENNVNFISSIEQIAKEAIKEADAKQTPLKEISKRQKTSDIRKNRLAEKEVNRKKEVFDLDAVLEESNDQETVVVPFEEPNSETKEDYELPSVRDMFRKRKEANK
ncbi:Mu transposase C-terminal domain-containing protein [Alkalibacillus salilacus]|uniref:Lambda repressor-like predicted transcriptional regulator n=1 Tax=Alkalibacillus salilacus TaxID=284582 RepID=A0ABT9VES6_9BACI|nr:Mu transposase C-terminal domain-containing protein [Alkalibacillus salilacus]MDQ0159475.1 lambda repressor-like predicted transcriptional regulator [Alkalibacillus salilacus]